MFCEADTEFELLPRQSRFSMLSNTALHPPSYPSSMQQYLVTAHFTMKHKNENSLKSVTKSNTIMNQTYTFAHILLPPQHSP